MPPQPRGQAWQAYRCFWRLITVSPESFSTRSNVKSSTDDPPQFLIGVSPVKPENMVSPGVPHVLNIRLTMPFVAGALKPVLATSLLIKLMNLTLSLSAILASFLYSAKNCLANALTSSGRATEISFAPKKETAFSFLLPITAPRPDLAAIRALSVAIPDMRESFSPDMPIDAI